METSVDWVKAGGMRNDHSPTPAIYPPSESMRPTLVGRDYMVSAGHPIVAQIMAGVLERGGTAIDAGVAGGIACNVVQVDMCNFGGIAPILLRQAGSDDVVSIAGVGPWGREATLDRVLERYGGDLPLGSGSGVVPAAPDAWLSALRYGTWSFGDVASASISYARDGMPLDHRTATALGIMGRGFSKWDSSRSVYWPKGRAPVTGETIVQRDLARTLERMASAEQGDSRLERIDNVRAAFYEGEIADALVDFNQADGGWLTRADLAEFRNEVSPAPFATFQGWRVHASGMHSQGPVLLQALAILDGLDIGKLAQGSAEHSHLIAEALNRAFHDRERYYCDPAFATVGLDQLLDEAHIARLRATISPDGINDADIEDGPARAARPRFDTTYVAAVDAAGNVFSAMPSDTLDGAPIVPGIGCMVSPRGVQNRLDPSHPAVIAPGKRPRITPAPALAIKGAQSLAFGCPGGDVIVQAMLQGFVNLVAHGMLPQQAVEAARIATFSFPGSFFPNPCFPRRLNVEQRVPEDVRARLASLGHEVMVWPDYEFDAGAVIMAGNLDLGSGTPALVGAADPRRTSYAVGR